MFEAPCEITRLPVVTLIALNIVLMTNITAYFFAKGIIVAVAPMKLSIGISAVKITIATVIAAMMLLNIAVEATRCAFSVSFFPNSLEI